VVEDPAALPQAPVVEVWRAPRSGVVASVEPRPIGRAITALGGGRMRVDDVVDPAVGFVITAKPGMRVDAGTPLASIHARRPGDVAAAAAALDAAIRIAAADAPGARATPLVTHRVDAAGVAAP
jgi:thymidine phosphorylase